MHEEGGFVYFKDAFGPDMDSVVVSSEICAAEPAEMHSKELPNHCNALDLSGSRNVSVQFGDEVDELRLQCIDIGGLGEAQQASVHSSDQPVSLDMDDPRPGLPVLEFRDPAMVSDFASDIDPGPGDSFGRADRAGSWLACIGFLVLELTVCMRQSGWLPREMDFPADLFLWVDTSLLCFTGMDGRWIYVHSGRNVYEVFLQRWEVACTLILV